MDAIELARWQFGFTVSFHIIFPAFTIGLASYLAVLEALWLRTGRGDFLTLFNYWKKPFAITFAMGVVSGIVMAYQFGTNWSVFSDKAGPVIGPLMGYEVLTAFFLESGFLGIMLFGMARVGRGLHFVATIMVAFGTALSAFWILAANSWMQTPAGYGTNEVGQFVPTDWWEVIFNPSFPYRFAHMVIAAYLATALVVGAVGAWHLTRARDNEPVRIMFSMAMWMLAIVTPIQIIAGDLHGLNTFVHQPAKIAAIEGHFETQASAPLILFGWPDMAAETTRYAIEIPKLGSLILAHDWNATIRGLKEWPPADRPYAPVVFWSFRLMVGLGVLMTAIGLASLWLRYRRRLYRPGVLHWTALAMGPMGFVAVIAGWITTEVGRQPYTIYGLLRIVQSHSPIAAPAVGASLIGFILIYFTVFGAGILYLLRAFGEPPRPAEPDLPEDVPLRSVGLMPGPVLLDPRPEGRP